jgi:uncharacterized DUF497 family protein
VDFDWDDKKARANLAKHRVGFSEAASVFGDASAITFHDPDHSEVEDRFLTFGFSMRGRVLAVIHTARRGSIRIISARSATRRERKIYEEG